MKDTEAIANTLDKVTRELKIAINEAEDILKTAGKTKSGVIHGVRARFESSVRNAKDDVADLQKEAVKKIRDAARSTDGYVRDHAWNVVGAGVCVGLLAGWLVAHGNHVARNSAR
jgi:ElaB/YqjD/DUF883 family membrane-anchored ribosome-binding protein